MLFKSLILFLHGFLYISIEGFFIERFINQCKLKNIILQDLHIENNSFINAKILQSDFREIRHIAKKTKCKVKINKKIGIPFIINKYRKRKIFAIAFLVIAIFILIITNFIWNIEILGNEKISSEEIIELMEKHGISLGKRKKEIDIDKIINSIRLEREDIAWIGIEIKGTNAIISIRETTKMPEMIDKNEICNIVASESAVISKMIIQNGTPVVNVGDKVKKGDLIVEGVMEGKYTGKRQVHSEATILGKICYEKTKSEKYVQFQKTETGNKENKKEFCINNFKINFNKGVSKFENYDTIRSSKKLKIFNNFYFPITINEIAYIEINEEERDYTEDELVKKIEKELENEMESEFEISKFDESDKVKSIEVNTEEDGITLKLIYEIQKEIGVEEKIN
jgi:similar to stage IV sporulation protein